MTTKERDTARDNGRIWGWVCEGEFRPLSKVLLMSAELGPPPFSIKLMSGEVRDIVDAPEEFVLVEPDPDPLIELLEAPEPDPEPEIREPEAADKALAARLATDFAPIPPA